LEETKIQPQDIHTLMELGCTEGQARIYLWLTRLDVAKASAITEVSKIHRQEVYRILHELQEKSLVEKLISSPTTYRAIPIEAGLTFLLKTKANELEKLQNEASELIKNQSRASVNAVEVGSMYRLIPKKDAYILSLTASAEATKNEVDVYCSNVHFSQSMFHIGKSHDKLSEDIKKRFIIYMAKNSESLGIGFLKEIKRVKNFECRILPGAFTGQISIYDRKEVYIPCYMTENFGDCPYLWSNNKYLVDMLGNYFDLLWEQAKTISP
jgi:sugar-specific transcriptional regulator TrmB